MATLSDKLCDCGCGQRTTLIEKTSAALGRVKGEPNRFVYGHARGWENAAAAARKGTGRSAEEERAVRRERRREAYVPRPRPKRTPEEQRAARRAQAGAHRMARTMLEARRRARKRAAFVEDVHSLVVLERDDGVCGICGGDVDPMNFDVDHVVPLARGGEHSYANVQAAHPPCNTRKGART
jgi:5-methylcytosine-specific restriction endonuclease McrA